MRQVPEEENNLKVFLAGDSHSVCRRISNLISSVPGIDIVGETHNPLSAIAQIWTLRPDVVILDIQLQKRFGVDVLVSISGMIPAPATIMVATNLFSLPAGKEKIRPDFILDKFTECDKIPDLLQHIFQKSKGLMPA